MKKKTRRGLGNNRARNVSIYYVNINGLKSKLDSLGCTMETVAPDVIALCEIKTITPGYATSFFKARGYDPPIIDKHSGLMIAAKPKFNMVNVTTTAHNNIISTSIKMGLNHMTIVLAYGLQETAKEEERVEFFEELELEMMAAENRGNNTMLVGDLNSKIIQENDLIKELTPNGTLLNNMISRCSLNVLNFNKKCIGNWTRMQAKNGVTERSIIDYIIVNDNVEKVVTEMIIDEEKLFAPFWIRKSKNKMEKRQYSDHNAILVTLQIPFNRSKRSKDTEHSNLHSGWKISSSGMDKFSEITQEIDDIPIQGKEDVELLPLINNLMDMCFKKRRKPQHIHPNINKENIVFITPLRKIVKTLCPIMRLGKIEKKVVKEYIEYIRSLQSEMVQEKKANRVMQAMKDLENDDQSMSIDKFWKMKKKISPKDTSKSSILVDGKEICSDSAIIKEYEKEFVNRLAHKTINEKFEGYEETTKKLMNLYLKHSSQNKDEPDFTDKEVTDAIDSLSKGTAPGPHPVPPDVYKKAGNGLVKMIRKAINQIKNKLEIPSNWLDNLIVTIFKNKGSRKVLKYYRGVFLGNILAKILEKVIKNRIKNQLLNINILQAGSRTDRGPPDSLFILNAAIDHAKYLKRRLNITFYDYTTCFDSLWLEDCMLSLWDIGIQNEMFNLIFKLNESTKIHIKTPYGMSECFTCDRIVKQGSVLSSNICSASTGELCDENKDGFAIIGQVLVNDTLYVDDTTDLNTDINETVVSHHHVDNFSNAKRLGMNAPKCGILMINFRKHDSVPSLWIGDGRIERIMLAKFLGDMINDKGNNKDLIIDRVNKGKTVMAICFALCSEIAMGTYFVEAAILLYNSVFLSTIIFNSQAWTNLLIEDLKKLQVIQLRYLKRILSSPQSTANCFVFLEMGVLPIEYVIHCRQLGFLYHILCLEEQDPVKQIYHEQLSLPFEKNWGNKTQSLLAQYDLKDVSPSDMSKSSWKQMVKDKVRAYAFNTLVNEASVKTKICHLTYTTFTPQPYISKFPPKVASVVFKIRSKNIECKANRKSSSSDMLCRLCKTSGETQEHIINCPCVKHEDEEDLDISPIMNQDTENHSKLAADVCERLRRFHEKLS